MYMKEVHAIIHKSDGHEMGAVKSLKSLLLHHLNQIGMSYTHDGFWAMNGNLCYGWVKDVVITQW